MVKATRETHSGMQHGNVQRQEQLGVSEELSPEQCGWSAMCKGEQGSVLAAANHVS